MEEYEQTNINVIPCLKWVKQGVAKSQPDKIEFTPKEVKEIIKKIREDADNITEEENQAIDETLQDETETEPEENERRNEPIDQNDEFNFASYETEVEKPNSFLLFDRIVECDDDNDTVEDDDDSEKEDDIIKLNDNLLLVGHVEGDASILEVYVYNEEDDCLYCHHDFLLPNFPLCIEWLNFDPSDPKPGNLCAVGTMDPVIEVWDLDVMNGLESAYVLGQKKSKKKSKLKAKDTLRKGHTDAVLALAWNENYHHVLGSGSVDESVLLWDLNIGKPSEDIRVFKEKVQSIQWHPFESHSLLTGSCDKKTRVFDCRDNPKQNCLEWEHSGEIEIVTWNSFEPFCYLTGTSDGHLSYIDCRNKTPLWNFQAHEKEITGIYVSSKCPGLVVTSSHDGNISTWDLYNSNITDDYKCETQPTKISEKHINIGQIQCFGSCPNNPFVVAAGSDNKNKNLKVINLLNDDLVNARFSKRKLIEMKVENESTEIGDTLNEMNNLSIKMDQD